LNRELAIAIAKASWDHLADGSWMPGLTQNLLGIDFFQLFEKVNPCLFEGVGVGTYLQLQRIHSCLPQVQRPGSRNTEFLEK